MKVLFESDRECQIDGVGILKPGEPLEVDSELFQTYHGVLPAQANLPTFVKVTYEVLSEKKRKTAKTEGGDE